MDIQDWTKSMKAVYFSPVGIMELVEVPAMNFLMTDGSGDPNTSADYQMVIELLYGLAYSLKFMLKREKLLEYKVFPLEGLWWVDDMTSFFSGRKSDWLWTMMIAQPDAVTEEHIEAAMIEVRRKKSPEGLDRVRFERFDEGLSAQVMYLGPYSAEGPTIQRLHAFIQENNYRPRGKHHEIYLGDPRRSAPEKLRTLIRQPVERV